MSEQFLSKVQHEKLYKFLKSDASVYARSADRMELIIEGIYWISRTGSQWRMLPEVYGKWNSVYKRFSKWSDSGVFTRMQAHFIKDPDFENIMLDGSIVRAHPGAAGASKKKEGKNGKP